MVILRIMNEIYSLQKHPGRIALMRLRDAGLWFLYPWLLTEVALPLHGNETALQSLIFRVLVYLPCWLLGLCLSTRAGIMALKALRRGHDLIVSLMSVVIMVLTWLILVQKWFSARNLFEFVTTDWLFR